MSDLFAHSAAKRRVGQPLAERMRPRTLAEFAGQTQLVGPGRILAGLAPGRMIPSLILWGPPGSGKTTLARLCGEALGAELAQLSAVESGVRDVREVVARAATRRDQHGQATLLFIDELHRFSKAQQDALLPHVELGTVTLLGATTENPSFGVVAALLSRCRVVRLEPHTDATLRQILARALAWPDRGLAHLRPVLDEALVDRLVAVAQGDARRLLTVAELAVELARRDADQTGAAKAVVSATHLDEAAQGKVLLYDRAGDEHYGVISALIKSLRGSDPDAATYWLTRMLEAGEDPRFLLRRLIIFASEDIGNADPMALTVATSALTAFECIGLPEGALTLTQATTYLALAPKSNRALTAYANARRLVREHGNLPVPAHLRNASSSLGTAMGHGQGYKYPHDFEGHYVPQCYLPDELEGKVTIYEPSQSGFEQTLAARLTTLQLGRGTKKAE